MVGIIRNLDRDGRISIPVEYRKYLGLDTKDAVEISLQEATKNEPAKLVIIKSEEK